MSQAAPSAAIEPQVPGFAPELARLRHLIPLRRLSDDEFGRVMANVGLEHCAPGHVVFRAGVDDSSIFYLLEGSIEICGERGERFSLIGGSIETAHPLSPHPRARRVATATSAIEFVRLPLALLQIEEPGANQAGVELEELGEDLEATDKRIVFDVYHALMDGSFTLPALPDIALRVRQAANDPTSGADKVTRVIQGDPAIAAYCVRMANNAAYAGADRVTAVREAVVRMGVNATADMVTAYTLRQLYRASDPVSQIFMQAAWRHSARIAALSFVIARHTRKLNPEQALLGGLLHDIGMLIIISEWHKQSSTPLKSDALHQLGRELNGSLGSMVLRNWHMPDNIVAVSLEAEHWSRNHSDTLDVCDCVALAHAHDAAAPPWSLRPPALEQLAAFRKLPDDALSADRRLAIIAAADAELKLLDSILKA